MSAEKEQKGKRILVVEDSQVIQNMTMATLEFYHYNVDTAIDGKEALEKLKKSDYDLVLMDLAMPNMNGIECLREIRNMADQSKAKLPVVAFTGNAEFYTPVEFEKAGFDDFVEKPIDFDLVMTILRKHLQITK